MFLYTKVGFTFSAIFNARACAGIFPRCVAWSTQIAIFAGFLNPVVVIGKLAFEVRLQQEIQFFFSYLPIFSPLDNKFYRSRNYLALKKSKIFVMIRAIFFASNNFVSDSVVTVQEQNYKMN